MSATPSPSNEVLTPSISAKTPLIASLTPVVGRHHEQYVQHEKKRPCNCAKEDKAPFYPLPLPTRPEKETSKVPANHLYWHEPSTHGMLLTAPSRRSHSVAQIGSSIYIYGGSDGKSPRATNSMFIFDAGKCFK